MPPGSSDAPIRAVLARLAWCAPRTFERVFCATCVQTAARVPEAERQLCPVSRLDAQGRLAHAFDEGGVERNRIVLRTWAVEDSVFAEVRDTGSGIPREIVDRIFEPFFTTKGPGRGTGLGLSITRSIVTEFGGDIRVESELGQGARFLVRFPIHRAPPSPDQEVGAVAEADGPGRAIERGRVLIVDDDEGVLTALRRVLHRDHEVLTVNSGVQGRLLLEKDRDFDLILCDLMMPDMSGMDLHAWLSEAAPALARQVVFVTGGAFTQRASEYLAQAGNPRIEKPFDARSLRTLVSQLVAAARRRVSVTDPRAAR